jgi:hypothetical protein
MDINSLLKERDAIEQNFNEVTDPYLIDYFILQLFAQETLIRMFIRDAKAVNRAPGLPINRRLRTAYPEHFS